MEQALGLWVAPVLMIPGMALLVISTGNRYGQLLVHLAEAGGERNLIKQLQVLRCALLALYVGIALHAVAGLLGGLLFFDHDTSKTLMQVLSCMGVGCLLIASVALTTDVLRNPVA